MTSEELNKRIAEICDGESGISFEAFGGKIVPYIGWYWRNVNFDAEDCIFGIIPECEDEPFGEPHGTLIGFMENNKWGYDAVFAKGEVWKEIRRLLEVAVTEMTNESFRAVNDAIQALKK